MSAKQYIVRMPDRYNVPRLDGKNSVLVTAAGPNDARVFGADALGLSTDNQIADLEVEEANYSLSTIEGTVLTWTIDTDTWTETAGPGDTLDDIVMRATDNINSPYGSAFYDQDLNQFYVSDTENLGNVTWEVTIEVPLGDTMYTLVDGAPVISDHVTKANQPVYVDFPTDLSLPRASTAKLIT